MIERVTEFEVIPSLGDTTYCAVCEKSSVGFFFNLRLRVPLLVLLASSLWHG
jgi:hypothetical protein